MSKRPKGFFKGAEAEARTQGKAMSPGTSASYTPGAGHRTGGNGATTTTKGTISTQKKAGIITSGIGLVTGIEPLKWAGRLFGLGKKKTEKEKVEANIKKGYDVTNPAEMHRATTKKTYDWGPQNGGDGIAQIKVNAMIAKRIAEITTELVQRSIVGQQKDPLIQLKQQEIDLKAMDMQRKAAEKMADVGMKEDQFEEKIDLEKMKVENDEDASKARIRVADDKLDLTEKIAAQKIGVEKMKRTAEDRRTKAIGKKK